MRAAIFLINHTWFHSRLSLLRHLLFRSMLGRRYVCLNISDVASACHSVTNMHVLLVLVVLHAGYCLYQRRVRVSAVAGDCCFFTMSQLSMTSRWRRVFIRVLRSIALCLLLLRPVIILRDLLHHLLIPLICKHMQRCVTSAPSLSLVCFIILLRPMIGVTIVLILCVDVCSEARRGVCCQLSCLDSQYVSVLFLVFL